MDKQQKVLMSAERAIKRLAKLARHISDENLAEWMIQGDKLGDCEAGDLWFVATWLSDCVECGIREFQQAKPGPRCVVCGKDSHRLEVRRHARYCSDRCRQRAYRLRNGSGNRPRKQTVTNGDSAMDHEAKT
jgi:predicted nucleic acid-binding Zn ribbon protein